MQIDARTGSKLPDRADSGQTGGLRPPGRPRIAISLSDPNGIGPEVTLKALQSQGLRRQADFVLVGSAEVLRAYAERLGVEFDLSCVLRNIDASVDDPVVVLDVADGKQHAPDFGAATAQGGRLAMRAVEEAVNLCKSGAAQAMVTAPISKTAVRAAGYEYAGHTGFIADRTGAEAHAMMMVAGPLRVGLVTAHVALAEVPARVTSRAIGEKLEVLYRSLSRDFGIETPRIGVLGLNPHAGDDGVMGDEERRVIAPAIEAFSQAGRQAEGPFPADAYFANDGYRRHDAVLAMYHDQGLAPFKALAFETGVNFTAGLPIVRTSPDHGTAYDIAGRGVASAKSMASALRLALRVARRRQNAAS